MTGHFFFIFVFFLQLIVGAQTINNIANSCIRTSVFEATPLPTNCATTITQYSQRLGTSNHKKLPLPSRHRRYNYNKDANKVKSLFHANIDNISTLVLVGESKIST